MATSTIVETVRRLLRLDVHAIVRRKEMPWRHKVELNVSFV